MCYTSYMSKTQELGMIVLITVLSITLSAVMCAGAIKIVNVLYVTNVQNNLE